MIMNLKKTILLFSILTHTVLMAQSKQDCSRIATINNQEVLVDSNSTNKGEGLSYYLKKDPIAAKLFETYQGYNQPQWISASIGTLGSSLVIASLFTSKNESEGGLDSKQLLLIGGVTTLVLNYLISKTLDHGNERYLESSITEYNKRNFPKIYFSPFKNDSAFGRNPDSLGVQGGVIKEF